MREDLNKNLQSCPKCGGPGRLHAGNRGRWKYAECTICGFRCKGVETYIKAVDRWNEEGKE